MLSIQQLIKTLKKLQNNSTATTANCSDLLKTINHVTSLRGIPLTALTIPTAAAFFANVPNSLMTSLLRGSSETGGKQEFMHKTSGNSGSLQTSLIPEQTVQREETNDSQSVCDSYASCSLYGGFVSASCSNNISSQQTTKQTQTPLKCHSSHNECFSLYSPLNVEGLENNRGNAQNSTTQDSTISTAEAEISSFSSPLCAKQKTTHSNSISAEHQQHIHQHYNKHPQQQQRIHNLCNQQIFHQFQQIHTQHNQNLNSKQKQTQFAMSSLAAEPLTTPSPPLQQKEDHHHQTAAASSSDDDESSKTTPSASKQQKSTSGKPCFNSGLGDILQFMELIGNLKHTKRTGWVLRDVNNCESISGHMYRMSILTFLLDGTEGLNQIRCMELALVHDLAESLVGDITPFCGISKEEKKAMELKAMEDICKLIEPRGKRIMELFEEYEHGQSPESRFVKDLDRLDMVMQAFEYEKRDNCLLKHQEFFDSTEGKFKHPFVKKLVGEIYEQREKLAKAKGATPPPKIEVPNMDDPTTHAAHQPTNGHHGHHAKCTVVSCEENGAKTSKTS